MNNSIKMGYPNNLRIVGATFDDGLFHIILENKIDIPKIIEYSKHSERHFIFYNCEVVSISERKFLDSFFKLKLNYEYIIKYEKKFTSKYFDETISKYKSYIRDKKICEIL